MTPVAQECLVKMANKWHVSCQAVVIGKHNGVRIANFFETTSAMDALRKLRILAGVKPDDILPALKPRPSVLPPVLGAPLTLPPPPVTVVTKPGFAHMTPAQQEVLEAICAQYGIKFEATKYYGETAVVVNWLQTVHYRVALEEIDRAIKIK